MNEIASKKHKKPQLGTPDMSPPAFWRTRISSQFVAHRGPLNSPIQTTGLDYSKCVQLGFFAGNSESFASGYAGIRNHG